MNSLHNKFGKFGSNIKLADIDRIKRWAKHKKRDEVLIKMMQRYQVSFYTAVKWYKKATLGV
jgi:hypothetical protein